MVELFEKLPATACPRLPATTLRYSAPSANNPYKTSWRVASTTITPGLKLILLDVNSDGLPDLLDTYIDPSSGRQLMQLFGAPDETFIYGPSTTPIYGPSKLTLFSKNGYTLTGDLVGNGSTGAYFIQPAVPAGTVGQGPFVYTAKPAANPKYWIWSPVQPSAAVPTQAWQWPDRMQLAGDVDGDGLVDRLDWTPDSSEPPYDNWPLYNYNSPKWSEKGLFHTRFSRRRGTEGPVNYPLSDDDAQSRLAPSLKMIQAFDWPSGGSNNRAAFLADMTGDSLADLVLVGPTQVKYWPGDGRGNFTSCRGASCRITWPGNETPGVPMSPANPGSGVEARHIVLGDLDGDGLADVITWNRDGFFIYLNLGNRLLANPIFLPGQNVASGIPGWSFDPDGVRVAVADMNGNGVNDLVAILGNRVYAVDFQNNDSYASSAITDDDYAPRPGLLIEIDNGLGASTKVQYRSTADLCRHAQAAGKPWPVPLPQVMMVVGRITFGNQIPGRYKQRRTISFEYSDPVWDGWERRFLGFREVVSSEGDAQAPAPLRTRQTFFIPVCPDGYCGSASSSFLDLRTVSGSPLITETFDAAGHYLSTISRSYTVVPSMAGLNRFAYASKIETRLYDQRTWSPFDGTAEVTVKGQESLWTGTVPIRSKDNALIRYTQELDGYGQLVKATHHGHIRDDGSAIDDPIVRTVKMGPLRGDWRFLANSVHVDPFPVRTKPATPADQPRDQRFEYDAAGRLTGVFAALVGTVPLDRRHEDPARLPAPSPPTASKDGEVQVAGFQYDDFDNLVLTTGSAGHCEETQFDREYAELPERTTALGEELAGGLSGCGNNASYSKRLSWDRGFGATLTEKNPQGGASRRVYDGFGRTIEVYQPNAASGLPDAEPSLRITYFTNPGGPVQRTRVESRVGPGSWRQGWAYSDGMGTPLLSLEQADFAHGDGGAWLVSGLPDRDALGLVRAAYDPWFYYGDAASHPLTMPTTPVTLIGRDGFGRVTSVQRSDGVVVERLGHGALSTDLVQEDGQSTQVSTDGHGRTIETRRTAGADTLVSRAIYQVLGEPAVLVRSHNAGADEVERWMRHDSLGRMVENAEPNSALGFTVDPGATGKMHAWRYAYDNAGRLVGTSDARGCGKNLHYDRLGRLVAEDYSPCLTAQEPYSSLDIVDGTGAEVWNRYDTVEPGQTEDFGVSQANLQGRLVSRLDRSGHTRYGYDARGQLISLARQLRRPAGAAAAAPPGGGFVALLADGWFRSTTVRDEAGRPVRATTGAKVLELLGASGKSEIAFSYGDHGGLVSVGGSYGDLITAAERNALGQATRVQLGDAAATTVTMGYDLANRLSSYRVVRAPAAIWNGAAGYSPPAAGDPPTTQRVLEDLSFSYQPADLLAMVNDLRDATAWPDGAKPASRGYEYDALRRVTKATSAYSGGDDAAVLATATGAVPRSPAVSRVRWQSFAHDWQDNTTVTGDDAGAFLERSLGEIENGVASAGPNRLISAANGKVVAGYDAAGNLANLVTVRATCADAEGRCTHRFDYDWDEVGRLARARRWDYTAIPAGEPLYPALPASAPVADLRYQYDAAGQRVLKSAVHPDGMRHSVQVFSTLRLEGAAFDDATGQYERSAATEVVLLPGMGRVVYRPGLPSLDGSNQHVLFEVTDPLGSVGTVIDKATGELVQRTTFQPYGGADSDYRPARWGGLEFAPALHRQRRGRGGGAHLLRRPLLRAYARALAQPRSAGDPRPRRESKSLLLRVRRGLHRQRSHRPR